MVGKIDHSGAVCHCLINDVTYIVVSPPICDRALQIAGKTGFSVRTEPGEAHSATGLFTESLSIPDMAVKPFRPTMKLDRDPLPALIAFQSIRFTVYHDLRSLYPVGITTEDTSHEPVTSFSGFEGSQIIKTYCHIIGQASAIRNTKADNPGPVVCQGKRIAAGVDQGEEPGFSTG
jgi:hypothetical protein